MTTTTTPAVDVDVWGHTPALRDAQAAVEAATASGDPDAIAAAARALIVAAAAHGWPTATALVFKYETTGPVAHVWGLWRVLDADRQTLREWEDDPGGMSDESEEELVALDLISNRARDSGLHRLRQAHRLHGPDSPHAHAHAHALSACAGRPEPGRPARGGEPPRPPGYARGTATRARAVVSCEGAA